MVQTPIQVQTNKKNDLTGKRILVLGHEASLSGAPKLLKSLTQYLVQNEGAEVMIFLKKGGPLKEVFEQLGKVSILAWPEENPSPMMRFLIRFFPAFRIRDYFLKKSIRQFAPNLILNYTIVNSRLFPYLHAIDSPMLTVVQEMDYVIRLFDELGMNDAQKVVDRTQSFITCSQATKNNLIQRFSLSPEKIEVVYNSVAYHEVDTKVPTKIDEEDWRSSLNIPKDAFVVGACGGPIWRKGGDLFLQMARAVHSIRPEENIYFVWQGGAPSSVDFINFQTDMKLLGLQKKVRIVPSVSDVKPFFEGIDVFTCTSREEPFGMVILEAGLHQKPVIAFEKSGGPEEILAQQRGLLVPYGNPIEMADKVLQLKSNTQLYSQLSKNIFEYARQNATKDNNGRIAEIVKDIIT